MMTIAGRPRLFGDDCLAGIGKQIQEPCYGSGVRPLQGVAFPKHHATRKQSDLTAPGATWGDPETWRRANWFILFHKISSREITSFPALNRALRSPPKRRQSHIAPRSDPQSRTPGSRWR